jgi:hypothetical protein
MVAQFGHQLVGSSLALSPWFASSRTWSAIPSPRTFCNTALPSQSRTANWRVCPKHRTLPDAVRNPSWPTNWSVNLYTISPHGSRQLVGAPFHVHRHVPPCHSAFAVREPFAWPSRQLASESRAQTRTQRPVIRLPPSKRPALPGQLMGRCKTNKSSQGRADAQRLVATRLLDRLHDPLGHFSRLQRIYPRAR